MGATVKQTADSIQQAEVLAPGVRSHGDAGATVVTKAIGAMSDIDSWKKASRHYLRDRRDRLSDQFVGT